jgi:hypothetical protein
MNSLRCKISCQAHFQMSFFWDKLYVSKGLPNKGQIRHMVLQFTNSAATNRQLVFYLFDTLSRHDVVYNFAAKVRKEPSSWQAFSKLVASGSFREKLRIAASDPSRSITCSKTEL